MRNACFISYRHPGNERAAKVIRAFQNALESRICLHIAGAKAYLDEKKLRVGDLFQEQLAEELCRSATMILIFNRSYFDLKHHFCAREYQAMLLLERQRLALRPQALRTQGLILAIAFKDPAHLPGEIRDQRHVIDASHLLLTERAFTDRNWVRKLDEIAEVVADRYSHLRTLPRQAHDCSQFRLPAFRKIHPWLKKLTAAQKRIRMTGY